MSSFEEPSSAESKLVASLDLTHEPSLEPRTPKERLIHPSKFPIEFEDYVNTSKLSWHEKHLEEVSPKIPPKEWLMEVKRSSEAIWILSPSTTIPCSLRGTVAKALHNPTVETKPHVIISYGNPSGQNTTSLDQQALQKSFGTHFQVLWD